MAKTNQTEANKPNVNTIPAKSTVSESPADLREKEQEAKQKEIDETNKARNGVGTRLRVGQTRGRNPLVITWEAFDESLPETLPKSLTEFMEVTGVKDESKIVSYLISGYNDEQYTSASDAVAEFINPVWPAAIQAQFRVTVRTMAKMLDISIEQAAGMVRPSIDAKYPAAK